MWKVMHVMLVWYFACIVYTYGNIIAKLRSTWTWPQNCGKTLGIEKRKRTFPEIEKYKNNLWNRVSIIRMFIRIKNIITFKRLLYLRSQIQRSNFCLFKDKFLKGDMAGQTIIYNNSLAYHCGLVCGLESNKILLFLRPQPQVLTPPPLLSW